MCDMDDYAFMEEAFSRLESREDPQAYDICCDEKMDYCPKSDNLICRICNAIKKYVPEMLEKATSQITQFDQQNGRMIFGQSIKKTPEAKKAALHKEITIGKVKMNCGGGIDENVMFYAVQIVMEVTKFSGTKKKDNRNQLFAAAVQLSAIRLGFIYSIKDLVKMFKLDVDGISTGLGYIRKYVINGGKLDIDVDMDTDKPLTKSYLENIDLNLKDNILANVDTPEMFNATIELVDIMKDRGIAYSSTINTIVSASVFYLLTKNKIYRGNKKTLTEGMKGVGQNTYTNVFNLLCTPLIQSMLPEYLRL